MFAMNIDTNLFAAALRYNVIEAIEDKSDFEFELQNEEKHVAFIRVECNDRNNYPIGNVVIHNGKKTVSFRHHDKIYMQDFNLLKSILEKTDKECEMIHKTVSIIKRTQVEYSKYFKCLTCR